MGKANAVITPEINALIEKTVEATLSRIKGDSLKDEHIDYFAAMEKLLYAYPALKALVADKEAYIDDAEYHYRSTDIVKAPGGGSGQGSDDPKGELKEQRKRSYDRTKEKFEEVDATVRQFQHMEKFNVIRMYYFNEDARGNQRDADAPRLTWEDVAWDLSEIGIVIDERQARRWKNEMIRGMMVVQFGQAAAVQAATYRQEGQRGK